MAQMKEHHDLIVFMIWLTGVAVCFIVLGYQGYKLNRLIDRRRKEYFDSIEKEKRNKPK